MKDTESWLFLVFAAGLVSALFTGAIMAATHTAHSVIIERGNAYYHPQTGDFTWKETGE